MTDTKQPTPEQKIIAEECCYKCGGTLANGYQERAYGRDPETGYDDVEYLCEACSDKLCEVCKTAEWDCQIFDEHEGNVRYCYGCAPRRDILSASKAYAEDADLRGAA